MTLEDDDVLLHGNVCIQTMGSQRSLLSPERLLCAVAVGARAPLVAAGLSGLPFLGLGEWLLRTCPVQGFGLLLSVLLPANYGIGPRAAGCLGGMRP